MYRIICSIQAGRDGVIGHAVQRRGVSFGLVAINGVSYRGLDRRNVNLGGRSFAGSSSVGSTDGSDGSVTECDRC
jgi:hypothetical protein